MEQVIRNALEVLATQLTEDTKKTFMFNLVTPSKDSISKIDTSTLVSHVFFGIHIDKFSLNAEDEISKAYASGLNDVFNWDKVLLENLRSSASQTIMHSSRITPSLFMKAITTFSSKSLKPCTALLPISVWNDICANPEFESLINSDKNFKVPENGIENCFVGSLFGLALYTDGYRNKEHKCLKPDEIIFLAEPSALGYLSYDTEKDHVNKSLDDGCEFKSFCIFTTSLLTLNSNAILRVILV